MNPLINTKDLSDEQLEEKISDLQHRLGRAAIHSGSAVGQLVAMLEVFQEERINRELLKEHEEDPNKDAGVVLDTSDDAPKEKDALDKLIDIN